MKIDRSQLTQLLEKEMRTNSGWLRVHAAEALLDNGQSAGIKEFFLAELKTAQAPYQISVCRVLARTSAGDDRNHYIESIRSALRDPLATNRISAAESLGKLGAASRDDREFIAQWRPTVDDAIAVFPQWLQVLSSNPSERPTEEATLAKYLDSNDPIARLRAAFSLGRLSTLQPESAAHLQKQFEMEPVDSIARVYLITALLLHARESATITRLENALKPYIKNGKDNEQLEAGIVLGLCGRISGVKQLEPMLTSAEADGRIGAASGILRLLK